MTNFYLALPVILPFVVAVPVYFVGKKNESLASFITTIFCFLEFFCSLFYWICFPGLECSISALGIGFRWTGFQAVYAVICSFLWAGSASLNRWYFHGHHHLTRYFFFLLLTLGATMGVFLSSDLLTTFLFFEMMSFTSYAWVIQEETTEALAAGKTYLTIAVLGGLVSLMGLFLLKNICGTLDILQLSAVLSEQPKTVMLYFSAFCLLFGFGAKAGMYPLHIWLPKAHPVAPAPASALLSGILTKAGIFGILVISGQILRYDHIFGGALLILGSITMFWGAILAISSVNIKRTLACSSMSQIGFILIGIGISSFLEEENVLAVNGVFLYMMNHSIVKLILFLMAGILYGKFHTLDLNELKGCGKKQPLLLICFTAGAASLSGLPGTLGYLAKTLIHEGIAEYAEQSSYLFRGLEYLFLLGGGLTLSYMIKLFVVLFVESGGKSEDCHPISPILYGMPLLSAMALLSLGIFPSHAETLSSSMSGFLAGEGLNNYRFYSLNNLKGILISAIIGCCVYFFVIRLFFHKNRTYIDRIPPEFSLESILYRPFGRLLISVCTGLAKIISGITDFCVPKILHVFQFLARLLSDILDAFLYLLRKTIFTDAKQPEEVQHISLARRVSMIKAQKRGDDPEYAGDHAEMLLQTTWVAREQAHSSFAFALLMTCIGISLILLFLLIFALN